MAQPSPKKKVTGAVVRRLELPGRVVDPMTPAHRRSMKQAMKLSGIKPKPGRPPKM